MPSSGAQMGLVSVGSDKEAREIARSLVKNKLAACVQILPMSSVYEWQDKIEEDQELLLLIKSTSEKAEAIKEEVNRLHSYDVAEILMFDVVDGDSSYLNWLQEIVR